MPALNRLALSGRKRSARLLAPIKAKRDKAREEPNNGLKESYKY